MNYRRASVVIATALLVATGTAVTVAGASLDGATPRTTDAQPSGQQDLFFQSYEVSNLSVQPTAQPGEVIEVTADISNPSDFPTIRPVELRIDGSLVDLRQWALNPGETEQITFVVETPDLEPGTHFVSVLTEADGQVTTFDIETGPTPPEASVTFEDQTSDGTSAVIANASNGSAPFYAAVWTVNETANETTTEPETLLGFTQVDDTSATNLTVNFTEATINESQTLVAAAHPDLDGNASTIDPDTETILAADTANVTVEEEPPTEPDVYISKVLHYRGFGDQAVRNNCVFLRTTGDQPVDVGGLTLASDGVEFSALPSNATVPANGTHVVHWNQNGTDAANDSWTGTSLGNFSTEEGELALLETDVNTSNVTSEDVLDYVRWDVDETWGTDTVDANASLQSVAIEAGAWDGSFVNVSGVDFTRSELQLVDPFAGPGGSATAWEIVPKQDPIATVSIDDQASDGTNVTVAATTLPEDGYVAIHELPIVQNGSATNSVIGVSEYLEPGTHTNVTVTLFEGVPGQTFDRSSLENNETIIAMPHQETNDNTSYDFVATNGSEDGPYLTAEGAPVVDPANITVEAEPPTPEAAVTFEDQSSDGTSALIANASNASAPFYTAVWTINESTDAPETLLGFAQVNETTATNLTVNFTEATINDSQTLVAAVHPDLDGNASTIDPDTETILASDTANVTVEEEPPANVTAGVTFDDQTSDGTSAVVASASNTSTPFYTAVWTVNASTGTPDTLLGFEQLGEVEATDVTVNFTEATINESQTLIAAIHPDLDGNVSTVDPDTETILAADTANVTIEAEPPANMTASVSFEDQESNGTTVVLQSVTVPESGYVAIQTPGFFGGQIIGSMIGVSEYLEAGTHTNVTVTLFDVPGADFNETTLNESGTLLAVPYTETTGDQSFDFVASGGVDDGPYLDGEGEPIFDVAIVTVEAANTSTSQASSVSLSSIS